MQAVPYPYPTPATLIYAEAQPPLQILLFYIDKSYPCISLVSHSGHAHTPLKNTASPF